MLLVAAMTAAAAWIVTFDGYQVDVDWPYWRHVTAGGVVACFLSAAAWWRRRWGVGALMAFLGLASPWGYVYFGPLALVGFTIIGASRSWRSWRRRARAARSDEGTEA